MPTPEFVLDLRRHVGHALLPLVGVTAVVRDDAGRLLLGLRSDTLDWALPSGIVEPGEEPAVAVVREVGEETGLQVEPQALSRVSTSGVVEYPNGDRSTYLDLTFLCRVVGGELGVGTTRTSRSPGSLWMSCPRSGSPPACGSTGRSPSTGGRGS